MVDAIIFVYIFPKQKKRSEQTKIKTGQGYIVGQSNLHILYVAPFRFSIKLSLQTNRKTQDGSRQHQPSACQAP